jgi:hypothetical protein
MAPQPKARLSSILSTITAFEINLHFEDIEMPTAPNEHV